MPKDISQDDFNSEVTEEKGLVMVDFWAPWCPPCKALGPILEEVDKEMGDKVKLVKVNVDDNQDLAAEQNIRGLPTVVLYKDGKTVESWAGLMPKAKYIQVIEANA